MKRVGFNGNYYKIPTLKQVLYLFRDKYPSKELNIEIKQKNISKLILNEINKSQIAKNKIQISSFHHKELIDIRKTESNENNIKLGILYHPGVEKEANFRNETQRLIDILGENICLNPHYKCEDKKILNLNYEKYFWTVNKDSISEKQFKKILSYNGKVNIISDRPADFL